MAEVTMRGFSEMFRALLSIFFVIALGVCSAGEAHAQVTGATLSGTVTDTSGAVIPGVMVSVKNRGTGVVRNVKTDEAGFYSAPNLLAGSYDVTASAAGFSTVMQSNITLTVGAQQQLNISMKVGETAQVVEVTAAAPLVQVTSSLISGVVESTTVRELPLNGRDWASLATLSPGVTGLNGEVQLPFESGALRGNRGFGAQLSISGGRPTQNNYRLDGLSIADYTNGSGSVAGGTLGVDAIQEFSVITGNYSAEYGRTSGGVINAISKSGTNQFHGDVYEFLRNDRLDANDFFSNRAGQPNRAPGRATAGVDNMIASKYLAVFQPPNGPVNPNDPNVANFVFAPTRVVHENFFTTRLDHKISDTNSLFGTYNYDDSPFTTPDGFNTTSVLSEVKRNIVALEWNHVFSPAFVNPARLAYNRNFTTNNLTTGAIQPAFGDPSLGMMPGYDTPGMITYGLP